MSAGRHPGIPPALLLLLLLPLLLLLLLPLLLLLRRRLLPTHLRLPLLRLRLRVLQLHCPEVTHQRGLPPHRHIHSHIHSPTPKHTALLLRAILCPLLLGWRLLLGRRPLVLLPSTPPCIMADGAGPGALAAGHHLLPRWLPLALLLALLLLLLLSLSGSLLLLSVGPSEGPGGIYLVVVPLWAAPLHLVRQRAAGAAAL